MIRDIIREAGWRQLAAEFAAFVLLMGAVLSIAVVGWGAA